MVETKTLDIIKGAILLEHRGKALYESVARKTDVDAVKQLFLMLVEEENKHIDILNNQFKRVLKGKSFDASGLEDVKGTTADAVLSQNIVKEISGAGYEAAVIAAALGFEKNAVQYYSQQEAAAQAEEEKKLFAWLVTWETNHMTMLAKINDDIKEQIWHDNSFWPF